ncbi:hypothetical protein KIT90_16935 [Vibrio sp. B172a]|uniref:DUF5991 domain-containing protein n=1 Tax=Vibrio sp. B172a TaxID=2835790 RepID=UPI0025577C47|nr:DUF5991 domain-containing protein [Vibrio sp. B172a]MDK9783072.1 hypothetical protein [Vibrio sp. B172a]
MNELLSTLLLSFAASASLTPSWDGNYRCELDLGENAAGQSTWAEYELSISKDSCSLEAKGFQLDESIVCSTSAQGDRLDVQFKSYSNGDLSNLYGVQVYRVNETLLSLEREQKALLTHWLSYWPGEPAPKSTSCFEKK